MRQREAVSLIATLLILQCRTAAPSAPAVSPLLDDVRKRTFLWFWEPTNTANGPRRATLSQRGGWPE